ncbi:hypothetical protein AKO1_007899 [Acrasis kona]|uniref:tRNA pseudouridine(55) synthase n=1 Tax=Acrasis kona TaxID=1008807 RepID=A0AAW2YR04_9EUKA
MSYTRNVAEEAFARGCCVRCVLHMSQCVDQTLYDSKEESIIENMKKFNMIHAEFDLSTISKSCILCHNIFRDDYLFRIIPELAIKELSLYEFTASEFGIALLLPLELLLRDHILNLHIQQKLGISFKTKTDRKRTIKSTILSILKKQVQSKNESIINQTVKPFNVLRSNNPTMRLDIQLKETSSSEETQEPERKRRRTRKPTGMKEIEQALKNDNLESLLKSYPVPSIDAQQQIETTCVMKGVHEPIYISGNYIKLERDLPQSPWLIKNNRSEQDEEEGDPNASSSVEEHISEHLLPLVDCDSHKFDSAGREDRDVRMLGKGRPFVFCMTNPKKSLSITQQQLDDAMNKINQGESVKVHTLKLWHDNTRSKEMHAGATEKRKRYRAVIWSSGLITDKAVQALNGTVDLVIKQNTPVRVLHRRSAAIREKIVHCINVIQRVNDHYMVVDLTTSAGAYVKEFVHSDFGRTVPSMASLLNPDGMPFDAQLLQLDVMDIEMD